MPYYDVNIQLKNNTSIQKEIIASNEDSAYLIATHEFLDKSDQIKNIHISQSKKFFQEKIDLYKNDIYLIEMEYASGLQLVANIYQKDILGYIKNARNIIPYLIKNEITEILEQDINYNNLNMLEKANTKKEIIANLEEKFLKNDYENLFVELHTNTKTNASKYQIKITKLIEKG